MTRLHRPLLAAGLMHLAALVPAFIAMAIDDRLILGIDPWIKPAKFLASIGIYLVTFAWMVPRVDGHARAKEIIAWGVLLTMVAEVLMVALQAGRGTTSHFNLATPFDRAIFDLMALMIAINFTFVIWLLILFVRSPSPMPRALLVGIRLGLLLFLIGGFEGGLMIGSRGHTVGAPDGGPGLPFVNWSTEAGDLRAAHFVGLHALQVLPILGWFLSRRSPDAGVATVRIVALVWGLFFAGLTWIAMWGTPVMKL